MEKYILIGSSAMKHHFGYSVRNPKDIDFAVKSGKNRREGQIEFLVNPVLHKYEKEAVISKDNLLTLKVSHLFWDINWEKHLFDAIHLFENGAELNKEFLKEMREYWTQHNPKIRRSNLEQGKEQFFTNAVNSAVNEHDHLHTLLEKVPTYTKVLKDNCEVELDENKWNELTIQEKDDVVFEETAVMAWERYKSTPYKIAFLKQLKDNIIKHFPEYIAIHAIKNYKKLRKPKYNFKQKIEDGLQIN